MAMFKAFKPEAMNKIASAMGYTGDMNQFQQYIEQDPARQQQMNMYSNAAKNMAKGGYAKKYNKGGAVPPRRVDIKGQDHMLAYITPEEGELLKAYGGSGKPGPMGIPSFEGGDDGPDPSAGFKDDASGRLWYYVQDTPGDNAEIRTVRVGSSQDTEANRQLAAQTNPNYNQGISEKFKEVEAAQPRLSREEFLAAVAAQRRQAMAQQQQQQQSAAQQTVQQQQATMQNSYTSANLLPVSGQQLAAAPQPMGSYPYLENTQYTPNYQPNIAGAATQPITSAQITQGVLSQNVSQGGYIKPQNYAVGGVVTNPSSTQAATPTAVAPPVTPAGQPEIGQFSVEQMYQPGVPIGGTTIAAETQTDTSQDITAGTGQITGQITTPTATAQTSQVAATTPTQANIMQASAAAPAVDAAMNATQAAQANPQDPRAQITAAQQTTSSVGNLQAAQGNAFLINTPIQRNLQAGELISGTGVDAARASALAAQTDAAAAQANPSAQAMVQDQLSGLMNQFVGGATPAWASGAIRTANATMAARGLSASSIAGQAIVQAAMESAMPIAMADAATIAKFESQNLSNKQQSAMLAAEQRAKFMGQEFDQAFQQKVMNASKISDIANQNFTAEQQVQLENSRAANTMNLQNLSNNQALVMAEAAALAQLDSQNLNNRQATAVQNAQNFLSVDMANLSNQQQTELFRSQQRVQSLFTDQSAENAARQFNASSQNQVDQFFANLGTQVSQFNSAQQNAQNQFNAGQTNTVERFNAELNNQRDQFNAQNQVVIAQSNAQWRRQIATADTAAVNRANELNANAILDISKTAYDNLWNYYADTMEWAYLSANEELDRMNNLAIAELSASSQAAANAASRSSAAGSSLGSLIGTLGAAAITKWCWVAREVYGPQDYSWIVFRNWMFTKAPKWLYNLYGKHGESFAEFISNKPLLKKSIKYIMDKVVQNHKMEYKRASN